MADLLRGPDVSYWNGDAIDWHAVKNAGASFAFTKLTEGSSYKDSSFSAHWSGMKSANLLAGLYHFARAELGTTPEDEARWFLSQLPPLEPSDMVVLDMETPTDSRPGDYAGWALAWLQGVEKAIGFAPGLYTYPSYATTRLSEPRLGAYWLWLASYSPTIPPRLGPWKEISIWQHSSTASYPGIPGPCDESVVARSLDQLKALGKPASAAPPPPTPAPKPHKVVVTRDMLLRRDPHHDDIYDPTQLVYKGATLDVVGPAVGGWLLVEAGHRRGYVLAANTRPA